jgi:hypothetical protein
MRKKKIKIQEKTIVHLWNCSQEALDSFGSLEAVKVNGDLRLNYCTGITKLPDGLKVNGYLSLIGCTGLTKLPDGLKVDGNLNLFMCTGLAKLPEDLQVEGVIYYDSDTGFSGHEHEPGVIPTRLKHKLKKWEMRFQNRN